MEKTGKFFVLEGMDGSGKATQTKLLTEALKNKGYDVIKIDFPQYGKGSAALLESYLKGDYGTSEEVGPYRASIFYACDRYDLSFKMKEWLKEGKIIIADRYLASNIGHQGGKLISNKEEWNKYVDWLHNLEFGIFEIPKPDYTLILKISPELSMQHSNKIKDVEKKQKRLTYLGDDEKQDIHEADKNHLANSLKSYVAISERYSDFYKIIECQDGDNFLPIDIIHQKIIKLIEKKI
jgi:dTMP kinase